MAAETKKGSYTGGANTGGANTGGDHAGGANAGGANTGGAGTGGDKQKVKAKYHGCHNKRPSEYTLFLSDLYHY